MENKILIDMLRDIKKDVESAMDFESPRIRAESKLEVLIAILEREDQS